MPVHLPLSTVVQPLTRDVFLAREQQQLFGRIEACTQGFGSRARYLGDFLLTDGGKEVFSHPSLFADRNFAARTGFWVRVRLSDERLIMHMCDLGAREPRSPEIRTDGPVVTSQISVDAVLNFAETIVRQGKACPNPECRGARGRELDLRRSVLMEFRGDGRAVCGRCYDEGYGQEDSPYEDGKAIVDGRQVTFGAPVIVCAPIRPLIR